jgi:hypothetical protein
MIAFAGPAAPAGGATVPSAAEVATGPSPPLILLSQTPWVAPGQVLDLHLQAVASLATADLGVSVSVYPCLSSVSSFDQSLVGTPDGSAVSSTSSPIAVTRLTALPGGGFDLPMPVSVEGSSSGSTPAGAPFVIQLRAVSGQCQSFPGGVYPVRVQLVDTTTGSDLGGFTTHLVVSEAPADTQRLRVALELPVQATQSAASDPSPAALLARPAAALAVPSAAALSALTATVATLADQHRAVPVTLQVSGQTVALLEETSHQGTVEQLGQLASNPGIHQLTAAPYTPVDAASLVGTGLGTELALQVARGVEVVGAATGRPLPSPAAPAGLGAWVTGDGLDTATVGALSADGFRQVVLPESDVGGTPTNGSTALPFVLAGTHGTQVTALASDDDLGLRFTSVPDNPVLAAHQLVAELAQLYYERPNGVVPRAVAVVPPASWTADPAFVDALLGSLDKNPLVEPVTTAQLFALFATPTACRTTCRLTSSGNGAALPAAGIRDQRLRVNGFATSAGGVHDLSVQLGDLVLGGEAQGLRPTQQKAVLANSGAAVDAQLGQLSVEGDLTVTLTSSSGLVPVTLASDAPYPVTGSLVVSSDKLLFPGGLTQWTQTVNLAPRHSTVEYVRVRSRTSGVFRLDISLRSPDGTLRLATGELSIRSTSSSIVGVVLTVGAVVVLAVWWFRTSRRRRAQQAIDEAGGAATSDDPVPVP